MKTQIALAATVAAALAAPDASAKMKTLRIALDGACDVLDINQFGNDWLKLAQGAASCEAALATGKMMKNKYDAKVATSSLTVNNDATTSYYLEMQFPFVTGGWARNCISR